MADDRRGPEVAPGPMAAGMLLGGLAGFLIWITTGTWTWSPRARTATAAA